MCANMFVIYRGAANHHNEMHKCALVPGLIDKILAARLVRKDHPEYTLTEWKMALVAQLKMTMSVAGQLLGTVDCSEQVFQALYECLKGNWVEKVGGMRGGMMICQSLVCCGWLWHQAVSLMLSCQLSPIWYFLLAQKKDNKLPSVLTGFNSWVPWRQIKSDKTKISLIERLQSGAIDVGQWKATTLNEYTEWLCKREVRNNLNMKGKPWKEVVAAYPSLTTKDMMER